ncbi:MAG: hypothetical protein AAF492_33130, partial [Verrucomicrobiota bacterium]
DVGIVYDHATDEVTTPVMIDIMAERFVQKNLDKLTHKAPNVIMDTHVKRGLRARLDSQSIVTGMKKVSLDYFPDTEVVYRSKGVRFLEIPTIPGTFENLARRINALPLEEIVIDIRKTSQALAALSESDDVRETLVGLRKSTEALADFMESGELKETMDTMQDSFKGVAEVVRSKKFQHAINSIDETLQQTRELIKELNRGAEPVRRDLLEAIEAVSGAAKSAQHFLDYLERHPEALLQGKGKP